MTELRAIALLGALAQETRLRIVRYLVGRGLEGAPASEIGKTVGAASSHLSALEKAGAISAERRSRYILYRANLEELGGLISFLLNDCCEAHPDIRSCCLPGGCCSSGFPACSRSWRAIRVAGSTRRHVGGRASRHGGPIRVDSRVRVHCPYRDPAVGDGLDLRLSERRRDSGYCRISTVQTEGVPLFPEGSGSRLMLLVVGSSESFSEREAA